MLERKLRIAIPRGSLNRDVKEKNRGHTYLLLKEAGWKLEGYKPGREKYFPEISRGDKEVEFVVMRPRDMPEFLSVGQLDLAICGRDRMEEWYSVRWTDEMNKLVFSTYADRTLYSRKVISNLTKNNKYHKRYYKFKRELRDNEWFLRDNSWYKKYEEWSIRNRLDYESRNRSAYYNRCQDIWWAVKKQINLCIKERELCNLSYGKVDIIFAVSREIKERYKLSNRKNLRDLESLIISLNKGHTNLVLTTEYPNIAYGELMKYLPAELVEFPREVSSVSLLNASFKPNRSLKPISIIPFHSTEISVRFNLANMILECVASGKSLRTNNLVQIGKPVIKDSTARLYTGNMFLLYPDSRVDICVGLHDKESISKLCKIIEDHQSFSSRKYSQNSKIRNYILGINRKDKWSATKIQEVKEKLQAASIKYGERYPDSSYYKS